MHADKSYLMDDDPQIKNPGKHDDLRQTLTCILLHWNSHAVKML